MKCVFLLALINKSVNGEAITNYEALTRTTLNTTHKFQ